LILNKRKKNNKRLPKRLHTICLRFFVLYFFVQINMVVNNQLLPFEDILLYPIDAKDEHEHIVSLLGYKLLAQALKHQHMNQDDLHERMNLVNQQFSRSLQLDQLQSLINHISRYASLCSRTSESKTNLFYQTLLQLPLNELAGLDILHHTVICMNHHFMNSLMLPQLLDPWMTIEPDTMVYEFSSCSPVTITARYSRVSTILTAYIQKYQDMYYKSKSHMSMNQNNTSQYIDTFMNDPVNLQNLCDELYHDLVVLFYKNEVPLQAGFRLESAMYVIISLWVKLSLHLFINVQDYLLSNFNILKETVFRNLMDRLIRNEPVLAQHRYQLSLSQPALLAPTYNSIQVTIIEASDNWKHMHVDHNIILYTNTNTTPEQQHIINQLTLHQEVIVRTQHQLTQEELDAPTPIISFDDDEQMQPVEEFQLS